MVSQRVLRTLLYSLSVIVSLFVVSAGGRTLFSSAGDHEAARVLEWVNLALILILIANVLLLVIAQALRSLDSPPHQSGEGSDEAE